MPHVYRPTYTIPIPKGSSRCTFRGKPAVKWRGRGGKDKIGVICPESPDRCLVESQRWYACYVDDRGQERRVKGYTDRAATEAMLAKLVQTAARIHAGLLPPEAARPRYTLSELLQRWHDHLAAGSCRKHAAAQRRRVERIATAGKIDSPAGFTPARVQLAIAQIRADLGLSGATAAGYLTAVKTFTRWLKEDERHVETDPLESVSVTTRHEPTFERRALEPKELARLVAAARKGPDLFGLTGPERAALYLMAASTGLRAGELASLTAVSFDLRACEVTIRLSAAKNRKADVLPFPKSLVKELAPLLKGKRPDERVWPDRTGNRSAVWFNRGAEMIAADLTAAGIAVKDARGRVVDFHALRTTFGTDLDRAGVSLTRAQKLMRHSTPALTAKLYQKPEREELAADVNRLRR